VKVDYCLDVIVPPPVGRELPRLTASWIERGTSMFLIRTVFWLVILVLLLPTNERQQSEVYGTAQAAAAKTFLTNALQVLRVRHDARRR